MMKKAWLRSTVSNIVIRSMIVFLVWFLWPISFFMSGDRRAEISCKFLGVVLKCYRKINNVTFKIIGKLPEEPCIITSNHQSALDVFMLMHYTRLVRPTCFIAKKELRWLLYFGSDAHKTIYIDRKSPSALRTMHREVKQRLEQGFNVVIYPEGRRADYRDEIKLLPGVSSLYSAGISEKFVPVYINAGKTWGKNSYIHNSGEIVMEIMPPIERCNSMRPREFLQKLEDVLNNARKVHERDDASFKIQ